MRNRLVITWGKEEKRREREKYDYKQGTQMVSG